MGTLSYMKIGKKEFYLSVGDIFYTNGSCFTYEPKTEKNKQLCHKYTDRWHSSDTIEISKKYRDAILAGQCSNLKEVMRKPFHATSKDEIIQWEVMSIDEVKLEKEPLGELWYIGIGITPGSFSGNDPKEELFTFHKGKIKDRTPKQIVLENDLHSCSKWNVVYELDRIRTKALWGADRLSYGDDFGVFIEVPADVDEDKFEKIEEWKDKLYQALKQKLESALQQAQNNLNEFERLAIKTGY